MKVSGGYSTKLPELSVFFFLHDSLSLSKTAATIRNNPTIHTLITDTVICTGGSRVCCVMGRFWHLGWFTGKIFKTGYFYKM